MEVTFQRIESLPRMAWCAILDKDVRTIRVLHGSHVEIGDGFFCEGAWAGDFRQGDFDRHQFMGSGGRITDRGLLLATATHTMERIFVVKRGRTMWASNSCAFAFAQSGEEPDPNYLRYGEKFATIVDGLDRYARSIPTCSGNQIHMFCHCNVDIGVNHRLDEYPKPAVRNFDSFDGYRSFLEHQVAGIVANANHPDRIAHYRPLAAVSSGYDSPAAAVLARQAGCDMAITFQRARPDGSDNPDDSGAEIAAALGMQVRAYDRLEYTKGAGFPEAEGSNAEGGFCEFLSVGEFLAGRILFTGFNGDGVWDRFAWDPSPWIRRHDMSGDNLAELRLRLGFVHLPVPYLGCTNHPAIHRITTSPEMRPWSVGAKYDRPIPRRMVEEAGVRRGTFAVAKKAVTVTRGEGLEQTMTRDSLTDFNGFVGEKRSPGMIAKLRLCRVAYYLDRANQGLNRRLEVIASRLLRKRIWLSRVVPRGVQLLGQWGERYGLLFPWAVAKLMPRYQVTSELAATQNS